MDLDLEKLIAQAGLSDDDDFAAFLEKYADHVLHYGRQAFLTVARSVLDVMTLEID